MTNNLSDELARIFVAVTSGDPISSDDDLDAVDVAVRLAQHLPADTARDFLLGLDLCPIHHTDLDTCADDELTECKQWWGAGESND